MTGLQKAIAYSRRQLGHLRKYGEADEVEGAEQLDAWLGQVAARQESSDEFKQAAGFARRDPDATSSSEEGRR